MAVNVKGGALEFDAVINLDDSVKIMEKELSDFYNHQKRQQDLATKAQKEYSNTILSTASAFRKLDENIQSQLRQLTSLQSEIRKVKDAQDTLSNRRSEGTISDETYNGSLAPLIAKENELIHALDRLQSEMTATDAIMRAASGSIVQRTLALEKLKQEYIELSDADREDANFGGKMLSNIHQMEGELTNLADRFKLVQQHAAGSINERTATLSKLKDEYAALSKIDRDSDIGKNLLSNIHAVDEELKVINERMIAVQNHAAGSINQKVAILTKLKNEYAALSETDRRSRIGQEMARNIKGLDKEVQKINKELSVTDSIAKKVAFALGAFFSLQALQNFGMQMVNVRGEFQKIEAVLTNTFGDKNKAQAALAMIADYAAKTPFELQEVSQAYVRLANQGFVPLQDELIALGDLAASTGNRFIDLAEAVVDAQTGEFERLKEFGIRASKEGDKVAFTFRGVKTEVQFTTNEIQKYLIGLGKMEGVTGSTAAISATLVGQISNLKDAWSKMLNDIGQDNENTFASAIAGLNYLVENYETVLDILKILVITYGAYKAAVIATNIVNVLATDVTNGLTLAQTLQTRAAMLGARAMDVLKKAMLTNPYVLATAAVAALVSALVILSKKSKEAAVNTDQYNAELKKERDHLDSLFKSAKGAADGTVQRKDAIALINKEYKDYLPKLISETASNNDLAKAYQNLNEKISENIGLKFKNKNLDDLQKKYGDANAEIFNRVIGSVIARSGEAKAAEANLDFNKLAEELEKLNSQITENTGIFVQKLSKKQQELRNDRNKLIQDFAQKYSITNLQDIDQFAKNRVALTRGIDQINAFWDLIVKQNKTGAEKTKKTLEDILKEENFLPVFDEAMQLAANKANYEAIKKKLADEISKYDPKKVNEKIEIEKYLAKVKEVDKILDQYSGKNKEKDKEESEEVKRRKRLEKLREDIKDTEREARRSGLAKEESEIDKINAKYDALKQRADKEKASAADYQNIESSRKLEVGNERLKNEADQYAKRLEVQKEIFERYEEAKKELGIDIAQKMYADQTKGFDSYISYLQSEAKKYLPLVFTTKGQLFLKPLMTQYSAADKAKREKENNDQAELLKKALTDSETFEVKRKEIIKRYQKENSALTKYYTGKDLEDRQKQLEKARDEELAELNSQQLRAGDIYKKMNQDLGAFSRKQLKNLIDEIDKYLKTATDIPPDLEGALRRFREMVKGVLDETGDNAKIARGFKQAAFYAGETANFVQGIAESLRETNSELADTLTNLSEILSLAESALSTVAAIASNDIQGAISGGLNFIKKGFDFLFGAPKRTAAQTKAIIAEFQSNILAGEQSINALYRERALQQSRLNKLKLDGVKAERAELLKQQKDVRDQFNKTLSELQQQVAVVAKVGEKYGGVLGIGRKTRAKDITEALSGKNFEQLEELFMKGQLEGKALQLFELLQKLKQEGADIDAMLLQNADEFNQLLTATTADTITDSILEGLANGKRGVRDFADDFETLMRNAILQSLKYQALEGPLKEFYAQFAADADSDGVLTEQEINILRERYNSIIDAAGKRFEDLQSLTNMSLTNGNSGSSNKTLAGALSALTVDQGNLLAGQLGGMRTSNLDILRVNTNQLSTLLEIQNHTSNLPLMYKILQRIELGGLKIK